MADAVGTAVGVVGLGLQLATALQTYMELAWEAEDALRDIVFEVNATASALRQLQTIVDADKALPDAQRASRVFKDGGLREVEALAVKCETVYRVIVALVQKASSSDVDGREAAVSSGDGPLDPSSLKPMSVFRKLRWPWLVPRMNRCQDQLRWLKTSLLVTLQLANLSQQQLKGKEADEALLGAEEEDRLRVVDFRAEAQDSMSVDELLRRFTNAADVPGWPIERDESDASTTSLSP